jgi:hypothetical protein
LRGDKVEKKKRGKRKKGLKVFDRAKAKAKAKKEAKAAKANGSGVGSGIAPAPKDGPSLNLRMRSAKHIEGIKAAAGKAGMSMNTWVCEVLEKAAEAQ